MKALDAGNDLHRLNCMSYVPENLIVLKIDLIRDPIMS